MSKWSEFTRLIVAANQLRQHPEMLVWLAAGTGVIGIAKAGQVGITSAIDSIWLIGERRKDERKRLAEQAYLKAWQDKMSQTTLGMLVRVSSQATEFNRDDHAFAADIREWWAAHLKALPEIVPLHYFRNDPRIDDGLDIPSVLIKHPCAVDGEYLSNYVVLRFADEEDAEAFRTQFPALAPPAKKREPAWMRGLPAFRPDFTPIPPPPVFIPRPPISLRPPPLPPAD